MDFSAHEPKRKRKQEARKVHIREKVLGGGNFFGVKDERNGYIPEQ